MMRIEVARSSAKLARDGHLLQSFRLLLQAVDEDHDLFSQTRRASRLTMRTSQHSDIVPLIGELTKLLNELLKGR